MSEFVAEEFVVEKEVAKKKAIKPKTFKVTVLKNIIGDRIYSVKKNPHTVNSKEKKFLKDNKAI